MLFVILLVIFNFTLSNLYWALVRWFELYYLQKAVFPYAISYSSALGNFYEGAFSVPNWPEELSSEVVLCGVKCQGSFAMQLIVFFGQTTAAEWHSFTIDSDLFDNFVAVVVDNVSDVATIIIPSTYVFKQKILA